MPHATLSIEVPNRVWLGGLTRRYPGTRLRILAVFPDDDTGVAMAEVVGPDLEGFLRDMRSLEAVPAVEVLRRADDEVLIQFDTTNPLLLIPVRRSGALLDLPFEVSDGTARWEVTATRDRLSRLGEQLRELDISFEVESVQQRVETDQLLTDHQRTLVETAVDEGYYDTPRDTTLTELAETVNIAKSTASETLHRAESKIIREFVD
jgi:hypothetical protein